MIERQVKAFKICKRPPEQSSAQTVGISSHTIHVVNSTNPSALYVILNCEVIITVKKEAVNLKI